MAYLLKASSKDLFRELGELEISLTQIKLLHILDVEEELTLKDLGESIGLSLPAASRAVEGLHQRGLVERHEHDVDRRMKHVRITAAGSDAVRRLNETRLAYLEQFAATLSPTERRRLQAALTPLVAREQIGACRAQGAAR
ncbi:MAG TPA: MarR family transcriptional regulator [Solirubrobacteraceae bacterium]